MRDSLFRKLETEYITPRILLDLRDASAICYLNDNLSSRTILRYLICDTHSSGVD